MPSDRQGAPQSQAQGAQGSDTRPLPGKSRVRSLLGLPGSESGNLAFAPTLPPPAFRYAGPPPGIDPLASIQRPASAALRASADLQSPELLEVAAWSQTAAEEEGKSRGVPEPRQSLSAEKPAARPLEPEVSPREANIAIPGLSGGGSAPAAKAKLVREDAPVERPPRWGDPAAAPEQQQGAVEPMEGATVPGAEVQRADIEVPGVSERRQALHALPAAQKEAPAANATTPAAESGGQAPSSPLKVEQHGARFVLPSPPRKTENPAVVVVDEDRGETRAIWRRDAGPGLTLPVPQLEEQREPAPGPMTGDVAFRDVNPRAASAAGKPGGDADYQIEQPRSTVHQLNARVASQSTGMDAETEPQPSEQPPPPGDVAFGDAVPRAGRFAGRPGGDADYQIEQLRHAVRQLNAKVASQLAKLDAETKPPQPEQPPPPVQPVVIFQRSISRARTPAAFWERSYLGRFHLRALR